MPPNSRVRSGCKIPDDATSIVVRDYIADPASAIRRSWRSSLLGNGSPAAPLTDDLLADQLTAMGWTIVKMTTLHRTVLPDLVDNPNRLVTSRAQNLGGENTTPTTCTCSDCSTSSPDRACNWIYAARNPVLVGRAGNICECLEPLATEFGDEQIVAPGPRRPVRLTIGAQDRDRFWLDTGGRRRASSPCGGWTIRKPRRHGSTGQETQR